MRRSGLLLLAVLLTLALCQAGAEEIRDSKEDLRDFSGRQRSGGYPGDYTRSNSGGSGSSRSSSYNSGGSSYNPSSSYQSSGSSRGSSSSSSSSSAPASSSVSSSAAASSSAASSTSSAASSVSSSASAASASTMASSTSSGTSTGVVTSSSSTSSNDASDQWVFFPPGGNITIADAVKDLISAGGGTVFLDSGVYTGPGNYNVTVRDGQNWIFRGRGSGETIIDCEGAIGGAHGIQVSNSTANVTVEGITFRNCYTRAQGAGLYVSARNVTLTDLTFERNFANWGAGYGIVLSAGGVANVENVNCINNRALGKGGCFWIVGPPSAVVYITGGQSTKNVAVLGGAGFIDGVFADISLHYFSQNFATWEGGVFYFNQTQKITMMNVNISSNHAPNAGFFRSWNVATLALADSVLINNYVTSTAPLASMAMTLGFAPTFNISNSQILLPSPSASQPLPPFICDRVDARVVLDEQSMTNVSESLLCSPPSCFKCESCYFVVDGKAIC